MIIAIRIRGLVGVRGKVEATLQRLRLQKKFACVVLNEDSEISGMIKSVREFLAYGKISSETLKNLFIKRGRLYGNKPIPPQQVTEKFLEDALNGKVKEFKPFFALHPPKGGFKLPTRNFYPKGVLGDWKEDINKLVEIML